MNLATSRSARLLLSAVTLTGGLSMLPGTAAAQNANQGPPPKGWFKACTKQADNDVCIVQNLVSASNGQLVTAVGLITVQGKTNRKILQVSVPSARLIQPGINMRVDDGKQQRLDYAVCMPDKCVSEVPLTDAMIDAFKKGGDVSFTSVNFQRQPNPVKVSLQGFTDAFDGPPTKQSDLEQRQKKLQEEMQKKAASARKKLEDAQEKAKSGN